MGVAFNVGITKQPVNVAAHNTHSIDGLTSVGRQHCRQRKDCNRWVTLFLPCEGSSPSAERWKLSRSHLRKNERPLLSLFLLYSTTFCVRPAAILFPSNHHGHRQLSFAVPFGLRPPLALPPPGSPPLNCPARDVLPPPREALSPRSAEAPSPRQPRGHDLPAHQELVELR